MAHNKDTGKEYKLGLLQPTTHTIYQVCAAYSWKPQVSLTPSLFPFLHTRVSSSLLGRKDNPDYFTVYVIFLCFPALWLFVGNRRGICEYRRSTSINLVARAISIMTLKLTEWVLSVLHSDPQLLWVLATHGCVLFSRNLPSARQRLSWFRSYTPVSTSHPSSL